MFALLDAREDCALVTLCFVSKTSAEEFRQFVLTYMDESDAGNGYGAYWVYQDAPITQVDIIPPKAVTKLRNDLVAAMNNAIISARLASDEQGSGGIVFWRQELPPRQRPTRGDMFRTLFLQGAEMRMEGRVIEDHGDVLEVIDCQDEDEDGQLKLDARIVTIPATQVMKISDRRKARRS